MKKLIFIGVAALVLVVVFSYVFRIKGNTNDQTEAMANYEPIVLYVESGDVRYKLPSQNNFVTAASSTVKIQNMTTVETGEGAASVLLPDNSSIYIDSNSQIVINYAEKRTSIFQAFGTTYHRVEALVTGGTYQVQTPETLAAVRGTKFAVKYDKVLRKTKVSVTEHVVEVSDTKLAQSTGTPNSARTLKEGETGVLIFSSSTTSGGLTVIKTDSDSEMKIFIDKEKKKDLIFEKLKETAKNKEDFREDLMQSFEHGSVRTNNNVDQRVAEIIEDTTQKTGEEIVAPVIRAETEESVQATSKPVVKLSEEEFFTKFEALFVSYFYLDEQSAACRTGISAEERVRRVHALAAESGYPTPKTDLLSFAKEIDTYCKTKEASLLERLQKRFDEEYPY